MPTNAFFSTVQPRTISQINFNIIIFVASYGENIYAGTGSFGTVQMTVSSWASEKITGIAWQTRTKYEYNHNLDAVIF
jgi:hypothetical protein